MIKNSVGWFHSLANEVFAFFIAVKLTKQIMHQSVTKSFLGQSFLSTTLLYAGLYTLVYKIEVSTLKTQYKRTYCEQQTYWPLTGGCLQEPNHRRSFTSRTYWQSTLWKRIKLIFYCMQLLSYDVGSFMFMLQLIFYFS